MIIDIIIPTLNVEKKLKNCLDSIKSQQLKNENFVKTNLIIVDGGSKDNTLKIAESFGARVFHNKRKPDTIGNCKRIGIQKGKGDYFIFLDSDEILDLNFFDNLRRSIKNGYKLITCGIIPQITSGYTKLYLNLYNLIPHPTREYKNFLFLPIRICEATLAKKIQFDPNLHIGEDLDFSFRAFNLNKNLLFNSNLGIYHTLPEKFSRMLLKEVKYGRGIMCLLYKFRNGTFLKYSIENVLYTISPVFYKRILNNFSFLKYLDRVKLIIFGFLKSLMNYIGYISFIFNHDSAYLKRSN